MLNSTRKILIAVLSGFLITSLVVQAAPTAQVTRTFLPQTDSLYDLGSSALKYLNIWGDNIETTNATTTNATSTSLHASGPLVVLGETKLATTTIDSNEHTLQFTGDPLTSNLSGGIRFDADTNNTKHTARWYANSGDIMGYLTFHEHAAEAPHFSVEVPQSKGGGPNSVLTVDSWCDGATDDTCGIDVTTGANFYVTSGKSRFGGTMYTDAGVGMALGTSTTDTLLTVARSGNIPEITLRQTAESINESTNQWLGSIYFAGNDILAGEDGYGAELSGWATAPWNALTNDNPAELRFYTNPNGATGLTQRMVITDNGLVGIGSSTPYGALDVNGLVVGDYFEAVGNSTSTAQNGWNLTGGCFSVNSVCVGGGSSAQATSTGAVIYVAANDAMGYEKQRADYQADNSADEVQINAALDYVRTVGGTVKLSSGTFSLSAAVDMSGATANDDDNPMIRLIGSGIDTTTLNGGGGLNAIEVTDQPKYEIGYMTIVVDGAGDGIIQTGGTERGNWQSHLHDLYIKGNFFNNTEDSWGINMESFFRSTMRNIEMNGVMNGLRLHNHLDSFNSGNSSIERLFVDLHSSAATGTAIRVSTDADATGVNNLISFNRIDVFGDASHTDSRGIWLTGATSTPDGSYFGEVRNLTFTNMNLEQVEHAFVLEAASDNTFNDVSYTDVNPGGTFFSFDDESQNNKFENIYLNSSSETNLVIDDNNTDQNEPNQLRRLTGWNSGSTLNANITPATIIEHIDLSGGGPTLDADLAGNVHYTGQHDFVDGFVSQASTTINSTLLVTDALTATSTLFVQGTQQFEGLTSNLSGYISKASSTVIGDFFVDGNLTVYTPGDDSSIIIMKTDAGQTGFLLDTNSGSGDDYLIFNNYGEYIMSNTTDNVDHIVFKGDTGHVLINRSLDAGNVGIGTTSPNSLLSVEGGILAGWLTMSTSTPATSTIAHDLKVESKAGTTTVQIGNVGSPGCAQYRDTDDAGWTRVYYLNGVQTVQVGTCE